MTAGLRENIVLITGAGSVIGGEDSSGCGVLACYWVLCTTRLCSLEG
jgi:hypothetical protein